MKNIYLVFLLMIIIISGCTTFKGNIQMVSTKNIDLTKTYVKNDKMVQGECETPIICVFPLGSLEETDKVKKSVDNALETTGADFLTDVKITQKTFYIPLIYGKVKYEIEGYPWYLQE